MISRAGRLIGNALNSAEVTAETLGQALGISSAAINEVRLGEAIMPVAQQARLARFIIETVPSLAGQGHALEAQALAATSFHAKSVESHNGPPPNRWTARRKK